MQYFLSLGSNINAEANILFAIEKLQKILDKCQSFHRYTKLKPKGFEGDDF
jgi:7,8-dihydro-6-hydroxymethylpterin-pyrophosphokinase